MYNIIYIISNHVPKVKYLNLFILSNVIVNLKKSFDITLKLVGFKLLIKVFDFDWDILIEIRALLCTYIIGIREYAELVLGFSLLSVIEEECKRSVFPYPSHGEVETSYKVSLLVPSQQTPG